MKHLKLFDNAASYEVWKNGEDYVTPSVSYVEENNTIIFYEAEEEFNEDELLYYCDGTSIDCVINLTTLEVKKYPSYNEQIIEETASRDEQGNIVLSVYSIPGEYGTRAMYWTSKRVNSIPMHFEYTVYDSSSSPALSGEFNEMITILSKDRPSRFINLYQEGAYNQWPILEIKSKISNKTHRIKFV